MSTLGRDEVDKPENNCVLHLERLGLGGGALRCLCEFVLQVITVVKFY